MRPYFFSCRQQFIDKLIILSQSQVSEKFDLQVIVDIVANDIEQELIKVRGFDKLEELPEKDDVIPKLDARINFLKEHKSK